MVSRKYQTNGSCYWLLFWPVLVLRYVVLEQVLIRSDYHPIFSPIDDWIPFREEFLIPYVLWYFFFAGMHLYSFVADLQTFRAYSRYLAVSFFISTCVFLLYPTCQNLRPSEFPRDNLLTTGVALLYRLDTNTNVCPSEHVIGAVGAFLAVIHTKTIRSPWLIGFFEMLAILSALATVFLKQHSVIDVLAALPVCWIGWYAGFRKSLS